MHIKLKMRQFLTEVPIFSDIFFSTLLASIYLKSLVTDSVNLPVNARIIFSHYSVKECFRSSSLEIVCLFF